MSLRRLERNGYQNAKYPDISGENSNAHGHYDIPVASGLVANWAQLAGRLFILQLKIDRPIRRGVEEIEKILCVEADRDGVTFEFFLDHFLGLAVFGTRRRNFQAFFRKHKLHCVRALVGELRDTAQSVLQLATVESHSLIRVPRKHRFIIRKLAG